MQDPAEEAKIAIVKKRADSPAALSDGRYAFVFDLNNEPTPEWKELALEDVTNFNTGSGEPFDLKFYGKSIQLTCIVANVESRFTFLKAAIDRTNTRYAEIMAQQFARIRREREQSERESAAKLAANKAASDAFNGLKL